jgi:hypothetical protein
MVREIEEQHPIPQDISSYQFRLVGDMTLKQFLQVAAGAMIALFLYASPFPGYVKWPLILFSVLMGVALAFLPIDDRPLGTWIIAFFRSIYNPTIFVWKASIKKPNYFQLEIQPAPQAAVPQKKVTAPLLNTPTPVMEHAQGTIYLSQPETKALSKLETTEENFLSKISHLFSTTAAIDTSRQKEIKLSPAAEEAAKVSQTLNISLPQDAEPKAQTPPVTENETTSMTSTVNPTLQKGQQISGENAQFSQAGTGPEPPTSPNIVVGQVVEPDGSIIEGVILEIKDEQARPVRALKTNRLGYFMIVTPLMNGKYEITCEKEGFEFDQVIFRAEGNIISPIIIKAKQNSQNQQATN